MKSLSRLWLYLTGGVSPVRRLAAMRLPYRHAMAPAILRKINKKCAKADKKRIITISI